MARNFIQSFVTGTKVFAIGLLFIIDILNYMNSNLWIFF